MDTVFLHGLQVECIIGVYQWERQRRQTLILDLDLGVDFQAAIDNDDIRKTVSYAEIADYLNDELPKQQFILLETLAEYVAQLLLIRSGISWVRVRVTKPGILPKVREVGVQIERHNTLNIISDGQSV
ncbi:dihydroneopterin aldolase [Stenoxybacter acetivorans]|uniref:dihydroneopterin aldolase n=1 Tax=Stenoxybacter acetivorans TaxID=422441 RepID=UPI00068F204D|nr:dihydroneopterin aldolase [Stenoxybacter acetivorans]